MHAVHAGRIQVFAVLVENDLAVGLDLAHRHAKVVGHGLAKGLELLRGQTDGSLAVHAVPDVLDRRRHEDAIIDVYSIGADLDRELAAVLAAPQLRGKQEVQRLTEQLVRGVAE